MLRTVDSNQDAPDSIKLPLTVKSYDSGCILHVALMP